MLPIRGLKVRIADTLQEWSESLKNLKTPNSFRQYVDDLFERVNPDLFMPKAGGTFTGPVYMAGEAENDISPTTLAQVRNMIAAMPHHTQQQILQWIAAEIAKIPAGITQQQVLNLIAAEIAKIPATDTSELMPKSGGTFTGDIVLKGNADQPLEPVTLQQMVAAIAAIPVADTSALMPKSGGTFTGDIILRGDADQPLEPTTLQQVMALVSGVPPADLSGLMSKSGGTFTGAVTMHGDATQPLQPATLQQLNSTIATEIAKIPSTDTSGLMPKSGGTFTGDVVLKGDADQPLEPTTLQQVQALLAAIAVPQSYPYDINFSSSGVVLPGDYLGAFIAQRQITIPQNFAKCSAQAMVSAGKSKDDGSFFELVVGGSVVCTIFFEKNINTGVFALTTPNADIVIPVGAVVAMRAHGTTFDTTLVFPVITITGTTPTN